MKKNGTRTPEERKQRQRNIAYLIISLIIACTLWTLVMQKVDPWIDHTYSGVKVEIINEEALADRSLAVSYIENPYVSVRISGKRSVLLKMNRSEIKATADVSKLKKGESYVRVQASTPNYVDCDSVNPSQIKLKVEPVVTEERAVQVVFQGDYEENSQPVAVGQELETVQITGTKSAISKVKKVTAVIDADRVSDTQKESEADLKAVGKDGNKVSGVKVARKTMTVTTRMFVKKEVNLVTSVTGEPAEGYQLLEVTAPDTIWLVLPSETASEVESVEAAPVDISDWKKGKTVELELDLPEESRLADGQKTPRAQIDIAEMTTRALKISTDEIEIDNLPEGMTLTFESDFVELKLNGVVTELSKIKKSDLFVSVDALEANPSVTALPLSVVVRRDGEIQEGIEAEEQEVQVTIE